MRITPWTDDVSSEESPVETCTQRVWAGTEMCVDVVGGNRDCVGVVGGRQR